MHTLQQPKPLVAAKLYAGRGTKPDNEKEMRGFFCMPWHRLLVEGNGGNGLEMTDGLDEEENNGDASYRTVL